MHGQDLVAPSNIDCCKQVNKKDKDDWNNNADSKTYNSYYTIFKFASIMTSNKAHAFLPHPLLKLSAAIANSQIIQCTCGCMYNKPWIEKWNTIHMYLSLEVHIILIHNSQY